ncbi:unnamed protein product [Anisakis simplex]|uniref:ATP-dependent RNA helicase n=1 Tax=Anisakis simplex TaxID=6269 RepID=A0A0M3JPK2_ANISI|nr:unnamed protein product [Anisakis simplex]
MTDLCKRKNCRRPHVVVATPGRLADHIRSEPDGLAKLFSKIAFLVLDEADRLLDGQYADQVWTLRGDLIVFCC